MISNPGEVQSTTTQVAVVLQVAALDAKLKSLPEHERMAYLQHHLMPAQAATQQSAKAGSAMTQVSVQY